MTVRLPTRLTRSSPPSVKKFEFDRIHRSHQRLLFKTQRKSSPQVPAKPKPKKKTATSILAARRSRRDAQQQPRWQKVLRSRTHAQDDTSSKPDPRSEPKPSGPSPPPWETLASNDARLRECSICAESKGKRRFPDISDRIIPCSHSGTVCKACILRHTASELGRHGQWSRLSCIECPQLLTRDVLLAILGRQDTASLDAIAARTDPRFRLCPSRSCAAGQVHRDGPSNPRIVCEACGFQSCFRHGIAWHERYTCEQYDDSHPDAASLLTSEERIRAVAKRCPEAGCGGFYVEKDGGCDSMWCERCQQYWSWDDVKFDAVARKKGK